MELLVKTWICSTCPFRWQFSGDALSTSPYDLSLSQLQQQFPEPQFAGLAAGNCPNCHAQGRSAQLGLSIDTAEMSKILVATDEELAAREVPEVDADGQVVMIQTGERQTLGIVGGKPAVITEPVYEPKQRELTTKELSALKLERDSNLDSLESVAVKEITEEPVIDSPDTKG